MKKWLKALLTRQKREKHWRVVSVDELPEVFDRQVVYLVGEGQYKWCMAMRCPCACGAVISLSTLADVRPRWRHSLHGDGTISIWPSIWRTVGCKSHFNLVCGLVIWHREELPTEEEVLSVTSHSVKWILSAPNHIRQLWQLIFPRAAQALPLRTHPRRGHRNMK